MLGKAPNSSTRPTALGLMQQASVYGATTPRLYGLVRTPPYLIWANNLRQTGTSGKKGKGKKGGIPVFGENVDFLIGTNPISGVFRMWQNSTRYGLNFLEYVATTSGFAGAPPTPITIPDAAFYAIIAVTIEQAYNVTFNDFGGNGSQNFTGTYEIPLWNSALTGPIPGEAALRNFPNIYFWKPGSGPTIELGDIGGGIVVHIYYAATQAEHDNLSPLQMLNCEFEPQLGSGSEYTGFESQRIRYPYYAGVGSAAFDLGAAQTMPNTRLEAMGAYNVYPSGDVDFADIITDIFQTGQSQVDPAQTGTAGGSTGGSIAASAINNPGSGYAVGDTGRPAGGDGNALYVIDTVSGGAVATFHFAAPGNSYSVASGVATVNGGSQPGTGTGFTIDISAVSAPVAPPGTPVTSLGDVQFGLNCFDLPGIIQRKSRENIQAFLSGPMAYDLPNTQGNTLIVAARGNPSFSTNGVFGDSSIQDSAGNTWIPVFNHSNANYGLWYAPNCKAAIGNTVTVNVEYGGTLGGNWQLTLLELAGINIFDTQGTSVGSRSASITTTGDAGMAEFILALIVKGTGQVNPAPVNWKTELYQPTGSFFYIKSRIVSHPGTYTLTDQSGAVPTAIAVVGFKLTQPASYPKTLGEILDRDSLELSRTQCRAYGLWGALCMDSQKKAGDWLEDLYLASNTAPVWSGFKLKSIPYAEVSAVGNGAIYTAPTAAGPVADLGESDFIGDGTNSPVKIAIKTASDIDNIMQLQHPSRQRLVPSALPYNDVTTAQPEQAMIAKYGPRKGSSRQLRCVQDVSVARKVLGPMLRRANYLPEIFSFKLKAKWKLLEAMNLVTLTEPLLGLDHFPVRLTSVKEDAQYNLDCTAEKFIYGVSEPVDLAVTENQGFNPEPQADPGSISTPIIFEDVPGMNGGADSGRHLVFCVAGTNPNWGGCFIYASSDGTSYSNIGQQIGPSAIGETTGGSAPIVNSGIQNLPDIGGSPAPGGGVWYWVHDTGTPGSSSGTGALVPSPSLSGQSRQCGVSTAGGGGERFSIFFNPGNLDPNSDTFAYDVQVYIDDLTHAAILEFDMNQVLPNGDTVIYGVQFNYTIGKVQYTANVGGSTAWLTSSIPCSKPTANAWHRFTFRYHRDAVGNVTYDSVTVDGVTTPFGVAPVNSAFSLGWTPVGLNLINFQVDGDGATASMNAWLDRLDVTGSTSGGAGDFPSTTDPDTVADLPVFMGLSQQDLPDFSASDRDNFVSLCYLEGGTDCNPYELISYGDVNPVGAFAFDILGTGGAQIRRGVFGTPISAHPGGSKFALLSHVTKILIPPTWFGKTIYFKFPSFNTFMGGVQSLSDVAAIPFVVPTPCTSGLEAGLPISTVALAPGAAGNFTQAHGFGGTPAYVSIEIVDNAGVGGKIWFQSATQYDGTNLYLNASGPSVLGRARLYNQAPAARIHFAPGAAGPFSVAHGLGFTPSMTDLQMIAGDAWSQNPIAADDTNIYLVASGPTTEGYVACWLPSDNTGTVKFAEVNIDSGTTGNLTLALPQSLGVVPKAVMIRIRDNGGSGGSVWLQSPVSFDINNLYVVVSGPRVQALAQIIG